MFKRVNYWTYEFQHQGNAPTWLFCLLTLFLSPCVCDHIVPPFLQISDQLYSRTYGMKVRPQKIRHFPLHQSEKHGRLFTEQRWLLDQFSYTALSSDIYVTVIIVMVAGQNVLVVFYYDNINVWYNNRCLSGCPDLLWNGLCDYCYKLNNQNCIIYKIYIKSWILIYFNSDSKPAK